MHVLVIGGTGFIGYHIVNQLLERGHAVSLLCRNPDKAKRYFEDKVTYHQGDLSFFRSIDFEAIFNGIDKLVYAAGIDEREVPKGEPYEFFYKENVTTCVNMLEKAKQHGVSHAAVLGSIFVHIDRLNPELQLPVFHPYIRSRVEQEKESLSLADEHFIVNMLEVPFVYGYTPRQGTIWKNLINYIRVMNPLIVTPGGANVISVDSVAQATVGTLENIDASGPLAIGDQNMTWIEILEGFCKLLCEKDKKITLLKTGLFSDMTKMGAFFQEFIGIKSGLDHRHISKLIIHEAFYDTEEIKEKLGYTGGDIEQAFADTIKACPENKLISGLQKSMDWLSEGTLSYMKKIEKMSRQK